MEFRKVLVLRGPNMWANFPVIEAWVDLGVLKDSPSDEIPGFNDRLMAWLPSMIEHRCSIGERSFSDWCGVRGSSVVTLIHCEMRRGKASEGL